jgi:DNA-binding transcriptional MerR regulator
MMKQKESYTIQEVSQTMALPSTTLRYYEEIGLLDPVQRGSNGHRQYTETDLRRLELIKKLRLTGMPVEQMRDFVALYKGGKQTARQRREILTSHRETVQARMEELLEVLVFIDYKIGLYQVEEAECEREYDHEIQVAG